MLEFSTWLAGTALSEAIVSVEWLIPTVQSIHIILIGLVISSVFMLGGRVLGWVGKDLSPKALVLRFGPWVYASVLGLLLSGAILAIGEPVRQFISFSFWAKMTLLAVGLVIAHHVSNQLSKYNEVEAVAAFSSSTRAKAAVMLLVWVCIIFLGRTIAYDAAVWGALSPQ